MTERGSNRHSPRLDDALAGETESLTRGSPVESRAQDGRRMEAAGDGEPTPDARVSGERLARPPGALEVDEVEARSLLAASLRPGAFPADRDTLARVAADEHADPEVIQLIATLPQGRRFRNVQEVWAAAGGTVERRETDHAEHFVPSSAAAEPVASAAVAPEARTRPEFRSAGGSSGTLVVRVVRVGVSVVRLGVAVPVAVVRRVRRVLA